MNIGIIDADLIGRKQHRFPNLASMKISGYWKEMGGAVDLLLDYSSIGLYDKVYISKVFTNTPFPTGVLNLPNVVYGGTGFYFDKTPDLPPEIEHHMPDYYLYDTWTSMQPNASKLYEYTDCSIGYLTRGCFRKCGFCVNHKYDHVFKHSQLSEFFDASRRIICLNDDNFFGYPKWRDEMDELRASGHPFCFKQGLDERILTEDKCRVLFDNDTHYYSEYTFAFDDIKDYDLIESKLQMIRRYTDKQNIRFYVLCGYNGTGADDIEATFKRIELLMMYQVKPFIMKYQSETSAPWKESKYAGVYSALARWCNQPSFYKKQSLREYCTITDQASIRTPGKLCASARAIAAFEHDNPEIAKRYFDMKYTNYSI